MKMEELKLISFNATIPVKDIKPGMKVLELYGS